MIVPLFDPQIPVLRPLVLGANGRIGKGFQHIAQDGLWPGIAPLWQVRPGARRPAGDVLEWDILRSPPPALPPCCGIICLAGVVAGPVGLNTDLALAAIDLALRTGCGPVLDRRCLWP
jgi:hypothetical protein